MLRMTRKQSENSGGQAQPRTLESIRNEKARRQLAETLPKIKQRPLHEYSELFQTQENNHENTTNAGHDQRPSADSEAEENTGKALDGEMAWVAQNNPPPSEFLERILAIEA